MIDGIVARVQIGSCFEDFPAFPGTEVENRSVVDGTFCRPCSDHLTTNGILVLFGRFPTQWFTLILVRPRNM